MLFSRTYKLTASGSKRLNIGLLQHPDFKCAVEFEDSRRGSAVNLTVDDIEDFDSMLDDVLDWMSRPTCHNKEFPMLNSRAKITVKNGRVILTLKSCESGQCVHLNELSVDKLDNLRFALYNFTDKLDSWRPTVKSHFDGVVRYIAEHKAPERQLRACIYASMRNCADLNPLTGITLNDIRGEFYANDKQLFAKYCVGM